MKDTQNISLEELDFRDLENRLNREIDNQDFEDEYFDEPLS